MRKNSKKNSKVIYYALLFEQILQTAAFQLQQVTLNSISQFYDQNEYNPIKYKTKANCHFKGII